MSMSHIHSLYMLATTLLYPRRQRTDTVAPADDDYICHPAIHPTIRNLCMYVHHVY